MQERTYHIGSPTLAILTLENGSRIPVSIPTDAVVTFVQTSPDDTRLVDVRWDGKTVTIFAQDLYDRGTLVARTGA